MDVDPDEVDLKVYSAGDNDGFDGPVRVTFEGGYSQGEYHHRNNVTGKFDIHINQKITHNIQSVVATLAHEIGHVKLLGEFQGRDSFHCTISHYRNQSQSTRSVWAHHR